ncbi:interleukin-17C-like [Xiphophorus maculatus]|nr:interleukin-17C-like [Xiphophorus maculatus]
MKLAQIFILALCAASVTMHRCYNEAEVEKAALKKLKKFPRPPDMTPSPNFSPGCPLELFKKPALEHLEDRSLSPWKYKIVRNTEFYPQTYTEAVCLCKGCIMSRNGTVKDIQDYNSAPVIGSWVFMKREKCKKGGYKLKPERRDVIMGCTCVRPSSSR